MRKHEKETLQQLSKDQLIYLIEQLKRSQFLICEVCVDESKSHITSEKAVEKIRGYIYDMPSLYKATDLGVFIDMKMGTISASEYRRIIGLED